MGKRFIIENIALKVVMIMLSLLLQKPSKNSKTKDHTKVLERRLQLCADGHLAKILKENTKTSMLMQFAKPH